MKNSNSSPSKKGPEGGNSMMKTIYSSNTFSLDRLLYDDKQMGFFNYDYHKKLYSEMELFVKLSLYGDGDSILRKLSFNRPEFTKIFNTEFLTQHMNLNDHVDVRDNFTATDEEMDATAKLDLTQKRFLFGSPVPLENKVRIGIYWKVKINNKKIGSNIIFWIK